MLRSDRFNKADRVIRIGFWANALLMVVKLAAGHFGHSEAVFADGVESACDFIAIGMTLIALKVGRKPYDSDHPYGHGKVESLSAIFVSLVIAATGGWILYGAATTMLAGRYSAPALVAVLAAAGTIVAKEALYRYSMKVGGDLGSPALLAIAKDHRKDAITSVATLVGVGCAYFGLGVMDPVAAGLTSIFIFHIGYHTFRTSAHELMDGQPEQSLLDAIAQLARSVEGVDQVHEIRARHSGQYLIVDLKLDMPPEMTVKRSHDISTEVKRRIFDHFSNVGDVMIHINPSDEPHEDLIRL
ncbi:cation diffusion facilitator family transporter [Geomonas sp. Red69]|uniref:Cation diffusion facilitator family transporter n=1 Tax=Geomonas diazotrophica TaxID=2843197 RepID=A0ABX8JLI9_9BACT|nr:MULTISPECIES: cation diffusion facilitator family transporter [Geomonas]MBU5636318.1 cation diffusion facilitator family transporter [Geomonas diazotrophica]QWV99183.1 cation diffusion facilitator family transporter [Geomonas nitrogeniifigens]QXE88352.1 cation diffusion facilitator family transporter [Geomonas nitrogeniifigens]